MQARAMVAAGAPEAERPAWFFRLIEGPVTRQFRGYGLAVLYVLAAAVLAEALYRLFGFSRLSPIFLASVLVAAITLGMRPALFAAVLAFSTYNFYLVEPRFTFSPWTLEEILNLMLFLSVALLTGGLAGRVRDEAIRSRMRARTMGALFEASRELSSTDQEDALRSQLTHQIAIAARGEAEIEYRGRCWSAAHERAEEPVPAWSERALHADGQDLGVARWRSGDSAAQQSEEVQGLVQVLVDLGAAAIARSRLALDNARAESLARTERLQNALLSSVSHDFRTPLTAILTSVTSLKAFGERFDPAVRDDLLTTIEEEAERLNGYVANLLNFTKLESGVLEVSRTSFSAPALLARILKRYKPRTGGRLIRLDMERPGLIVHGDAFLLEQALSNVLENAIRFSPAGSTVGLRAVAEDGAVRIEISDEGPGVPAGEEERIFEKFYRSSNATQHSTGLGLSIARGMIEAMGGTIRAGRAAGGGLCMAVNVPAGDADGL